MTSHVPMAKGVRGVLQVGTLQLSINQLETARSKRDKRSFCDPRAERGWGAAPKPYIPAASLCPVLASLTPVVSTAITLFLLI